ncbi:unnamed protein product, partial [Brassica rapa subsp. trilocularis]
MNKTSSVSLYSHFLIWVFSINDFKNIQFHHLIRTRTKYNKIRFRLRFSDNKISSETTLAIEVVVWIVYRQEE